MKMKKMTAALLASVMAFGFCGSNVQCEEQETAVENAGEEITITDMIGREVSVTPGSYERVVCVGAGALRMYSYIGDVNLLCGVEDIDNTTLEERPEMFDSVARPYVLAYEEVFSMLPSCGVGGPMAQAAEAEKILSCEPDIVISEFEDVEKEDALQEQLGVPVITLKAGSKGVFDEAFSGSMELLGVLFGEEERAEELIAYVEAEAAEITSRTADIAEEDKPAVYICGLGNWGTTDHLMTAENFVSLNIANVKNVLSGTGMEGIQPIEEEKFVELGEDMDIIIMDAAAVKNIIPLYQEDPTMFDTCKAWNNGEVYLEMAYNAYYTNFEIALCNSWFVAKTVYPELFEDVDMMEKTNEITNMFLGQELAEEIFACPSSFGGYQKIDTATFFGEN
ncbi:MAG: ABC transporter substrate-binding protein [Marvinbryantia sp.]|uniref:ABC transporter substrate-binding protein n=1 Tax=Marvinbryantia sp. TaxID=2496532 RepID=UPI00266F421C|nr:ABC transporter substrate-binding protein [uncultured Marvinbryantia sp.]